MSALEAVVNDWLNACLDASDVVSHGIHACLCGVDLDNVLKLCLAALQLLFPKLALWFAIFNQLFFWVLPLLQHLLDIACRFLRVKLNLHEYLPGVAMCGDSLFS